MKSMTGYGKGQFYDNERKYIVEFKSVNSKYLDVNIKLPKALSMFEQDVRTAVASCISRGKLEIIVTFENYSVLGKKMHIDEAFFDNLLLETKRISEKFNIQNDIKMSDIINFEGVIDFVNDDESNEILKSELIISLNKAIENFIQMRTAEGEQIKLDILKKLEILQTNIEMIEKLSYNIVDEYKNKIEGRLQKYMQEKDIDHSRILTEIIIFADKMTIDEEIIRFKSHILQFTKEIKTSGAIGKKLDFIIQEMNRETNTIGSKTNNINITNLVIVNKAILENIREQIQTIE